MLRLLTPLRIGASLGVFFALLRLSSLAPVEWLTVGPVEWIADRAVDDRFKRRGVVAPGPETVIVAVDDASLDALGRWPWPRPRVAELIDRIAAAEPAVIGFDMVQSEPSDGDAALVASVSRSARSVLGYYFDFGPVDADSLQGRVTAYTVRNPPGDTAAAQVLAGSSLRANLPPLTAAASGIGYFNFTPDKDGSYRRIPLVIRAGDRFAAPLSLAMLRIYRPEWKLWLRFNGVFVDDLQVGPTTIPVAHNGLFLINFRGPGHTFPHIPAADVLAGRVDAERLRGKLVLVGVTATAVADIRATPVDGLMPGVEIHANVIDSILRNDFLVSSRITLAVVEAVVLLVLALCLGAALSRLRGLAAFLAAAAFAVAYHFFGQWLFLRTGLPLSNILPFAAIGLTYGAVGVQHFVVEEQEKRRTRNALELYVTPTIARMVSDRPELLALGGESRDLTVMFLDIRGFTTLSEQMRDQPHEVVALLNAFLDAMTLVIFEHDGTVDKYVGDEIMAFWGAPLPQPDHAARACGAAVHLIDRLQTLNREFAQRGWPALDIGIGINSGPMVVGNMGSSRRLCYTVVGDNVNLAARLEGVNRTYGTHIIASAATVAAAGAVARELDAVRVRGKDQAVHVFEVLGTDGAKPQWLADFDAGVAHYRAQHWLDAVACFRRVLAVRPGDPPSELYLKRIAAFERNPPPPDWDGVTVMETK